MTFEVFLDRYLDRLSGYARLLEGDRHDAEDLIAETLLKAQRIWSRIEVMEHPLAYVRAMVSSQHADRHRSWSPATSRSPPTPTSPTRSRIRQG
ncbi:RNA polymerase sigma factor [Nakamurella leprariae]|uniref:RNA polymerase sigma-70 region 2 domain-containing protein n=1 Tax=Nakamurella leprariae TaxID=2803911 RepID=A0A939C1B3_9ACTN|nr:sigma factor [Nakamurella leprariae]MBM9469631.1 hypothetical protein [Nakamurella leprariae]